MSQYVILKKEEVLIAIECGSTDSKVVNQSLIEQDFEICSQPIDASSSDEALYFYKDSPQMYAIEPQNSTLTDSVLATLLSSSWREVFTN